MVPCKKTASGRERKAAFDARHTTTIKAARKAQETFKIFESDTEDEEQEAVNNNVKENTFSIKVPTEEDQQDTEIANEEARGRTGPNDYFKKSKYKIFLKK